MAAWPTKGQAERSATSVVANDTLHSYRQIPTRGGYSEPPRGGSLTAQTYAR
jgi:uncharacterized protein YfaQ (DUF2300 family)